MARKRDKNDPTRPGAIALARIAERLGYGALSQVHEATGISYGLLLHVAHGRRDLPAVHCQTVVRYFGPIVTLHDLRPDVFPAPVVAS